MSGRPFPPAPRDDAAVGYRVLLAWRLLRLERTSIAREAPRPKSRYSRLQLPTINDGELMGYDEFYSGSSLRSRRPRKNERKITGSHRLRPEGTLSLPDALAHEIYNPLCAAMLQVAALKESGHDVEALDGALQRLYAVGAELRLPQRLQSIATRHVELNQALGIVLELLGVYGSRVDLALPTARVELPPLQLCHFLHCVLVGHLEGGTRDRVSVSGQKKDRRVMVLIASTARSTRVRANLLALTQADTTAKQGVSAPISAMHLAKSLGFDCTINDSETRVETRFALPISTATPPRSRTTLA